MKTLRSPLRIVFWVSLAGFAVLLIVIGALFLLPVLNPPPKTYRFVFPAGTTLTRDMRDGGFVLRTMVAGRPPLPREDGFRLVRFDQARTIETSEEYVFGNEWFLEEHYIAGRSGRRKADSCRPN